MTVLTLSESAAHLNARHVGSDARFHSVSTDTRRIAHGDLFVALQGPRFDGHEYIDRAAAGGAVGALVSREVVTDLPLLVTDDTRRGLGALSSLWRARVGVPLAAVTGSNGKTTVKEMLSSILGQVGPVLATRGNQNNDIGVPLTLFGLQEDHRYGVIELGANHPGEIAYLTGLVHPRVALITNAAPAHLEGFGDVAGVARAKGEIFQGLPSDGVAVINADDEFAGLWRQLAGSHRRVTFGLRAPAEVSARWSARSGASEVSLSLPGHEIELSLPLPGEHNVMNALAASATAFALDIAPDAIRVGLESVAPIAGRLRRMEGPGGSVVIDDTYNANLASLTAALEVLERGEGVEQWLVLGDMGELGEAGPRLHEQAGREARASGIARLYALGPLAGRAASAFGDGAHVFDDVEALIGALRTAVHDRVTILVKGSRAMHLERVVDALTSAPAARANGDG